MKKFILSAIAVGLMSTSAIAGYLPGYIGELVVKSDGSAYATLIKDNNAGTTRHVQLEGSGDALKALIAAFMTAKAQNAHVEAYVDYGMWTKLKFK